MVETVQKEKLICEKCGKTLSAIKFYKHRDGTYDTMCKECLCMHVNNFEPDTYTWIMKRLDIPYIPEEWNKIRDKDYAKDPTKIGGAATFGKYVAKTKLKQFEGKGYADSEELREKIIGKKARISEEEAEEERKRAEELKVKLDAGEITEAEFKTLTSTEDQVKAMQGDFDGVPYMPQMPQIPGVQFFQPMEEETIDIPDPSKDLSDEDKIYLALKWGRSYKPSEWVELEKKYVEMTESFDIQDADTKNTLLLMCKTDLKMNQAIDIGDVDGYQKLSRVNDQLRKSGKFTAAQNKDKDSDQINCLGQLIAVCEREEGFIPRYYVSKPNDPVDAVLQDQEQYLYNLVTKDLGFGQQIETYLKKIELEKDMLDNENLDAKTLFEQEEISDEELVARKLQEIEEKEHDKAVGEKDFAFKTGDD